MPTRIFPRCSAITHWMLSLGLALTMASPSLTWAADAGTSAPGAPSTPPPAGSTPTAGNSPSLPPEDHRGNKMQHLRKACAADVKKYCPQVKPGGGRILECLEAHSKEVTDECYDLLEQRAARQKGRAQ